MEREIVEHSGVAAETMLHDASNLLLAVDPTGLDDDSLHDLVVRVQAERSRLAVVAADLLAEWDSRRLWASDGSRSAAHRLARETRSSIRRSKVEMRRARRIRHVPTTRAAVIDGRLSLDHLDLLAHANSPERRRLFERDEAMLVDELTKLSYFEGARAVRYWMVRVDDQLAPDPHQPEPDDPDGPDGPDTAPPPPDAESKVHLSRTLDDNWALDGGLGPIAGTIVDDELSRLAEQIRLADHAAGIDRTPAQRRAAALVEMATRSATTPADGRRPKPLFTVLIGAATFEQLCELANGTIIPTGALLPHLRDAFLESVLFDGPSTVISVSSRRTFTGALRRAIQVRDRRCTHKSQCDTPADHCDVDHIVPYAAHGPTRQENGRLRCPPHNRDEDLDDHDRTPRPTRTIDRLDELRALIRWRIRNHPINTDDGDDH